MLKFAILLAVVAVCHGQRTSYILYAQGQQEVMPNDGDLGTSIFAVNQDTIILIHDHLGDPSDGFNTRVRAEIQRYEELNVIVVNWEKDAKVTYSAARLEVPAVAKELTELIQGLVHPTTGKTKLNQLHLVGFGLGAHVAGIASRGLGTDIRVGRITGLDPSGSGWGPNSGRLTTSDAHYVQVIHTDGSGLNANGIGENIGNVNIYANGGSNQPGCFTHSCSHNRAYELFAASVANTNLIAYPCSTMLQMNLNRCNGDIFVIGGTYIDTSSMRLAIIYRINTKRSWPYA